MGGGEHTFGVAGCVGHACQGVHWAVVSETPTLVTFGIGIQSAQREEIRVDRMRSGEATY